jgi:hypothetical protein
MVEVELLVGLGEDISSRDKNVADGGSMGYDGTRFWNGEINAEPKWKERWFQRNKKSSLIEYLETTMSALQLSSPS